MSGYKGVVEGAREFIAGQAAEAEPAPPTFPEGVMDKTLSLLGTPSERDRVKFALTDKTAPSAAERIADVVDDEDALRKRLQAMEPHERDRIVSLIFEVEVEDEAAA